MLSCNCYIAVARHIAAYTGVREEFIFRSCISWPSTYEVQIPFTYPQISISPSHRDRRHSRVACPSETPRRSCLRHIFIHFIFCHLPQILGNNCSEQRTAYTLTATSLLWLERGRQRNCLFSGPTGSYYGTEIRGSRVFIQTNYLSQGIYPTQGAGKCRCFVSRW